MAGCKNLFGFLERNLVGCAAANGNESCLNNCESGSGSGNLTSKVESVGKPPGKRIRMKQSSFGKDGNSLVLEVSAMTRSTDSGGQVKDSDLMEQNVRISEEEGKSADGVKSRRERPMRQCVESRRLQKLEEGAADGVAEGERRKRKKGAEGAGKLSSSASPVKQMLDGGGVAVQCRSQQRADCVGTNNRPSSGEYLGEEAPGVARGEHPVKISGKAGADFFLPTSKRRLQLKEQKSRIGVVDTITSKDHANSEVAPENISKNCKQIKGTGMDGSKSSKILLSKQSPLKRKAQSKEESSQLRSLADEDGVKLSNVCCDLRLEAKLAAEENARLSAGRETHPFFMQQKSLLTRGPDIPEVEAEVANQQSSRPSDAVLTPCQPFHITQNDQVDDVAFDWKSWEFVESKLSQQCDHNGVGGACRTILQGSAKLLESETFDCFSTVNGVARLNVGNFPFQSPDPLGHQCLIASSECSDGLDVKKWHLKRLCAYLKGRSCNKCSLEDLEERFLSYYSLRNGGGICKEGIANTSLWTDKYQPESSKEVCGNVDSIKVLNDWLHSWHEWVLNTNKDQPKEPENSIQDEDWGWFQDDSEIASKDGDEDALTNVLLLTGPVGCGKSAAVYACAKEQGFDVIEVNASDCRNGALVKQKFGEAMESHGLNIWPVEDIAGIQVEHSFSAKEIMQNRNMIQVKDNMESNHREVLNSAIQRKLRQREKQINGMDERRALSQSRSKALILFEDVDTIFDEDRGFMTALFQLAETAKRPIILTSNRRDPSLPRLLDRLTLEFDLPSLEELLCHVFMVCVAEGVTICPRLVEHSAKCCCRDMRKTMTLLQFWCQGKGNFEGGSSDGRLSPIYSSILFELDAAHQIMPKMMPWSFPSKLSETINMEISKALDGTKEQAWSHVADLAEDYGTKDRAISQIKNKQKNGNQRTRKSIMLERISSADDAMQMFASLDAEVDETSMTFVSSNVSLGKPAKQRRHAVVSSDSEDAIFKESVPAVSETQLPGLGKNVSVELSGESDDTREISESNVPVFRRLKRIQEADLSEATSLRNVSCVPESLSVSETVMDGNVISPVKSVCLGNTSGVGKNFLSDMCRPVGVVPELNNLNCPDKREATSVQETKLEERQHLVAHSMSKSTDHYNGAIELVVGNGGFTASQTDGTSFHGGTLISKECAKIADDTKPDSASRVHNGDIELQVKHLELNNLDALNDIKSMDTSYETLPLMDECSRAGFTRGFTDNPKARYLETADPVQETWLKILNCRDDLKPLITLECGNALSAIETATKATDLISSSDVLFNLCELDYLDGCKPCHGSRNFYLYGDSPSTYCSDERLEITSRFVHHGLWLCAKKCFSMAPHFDGARIDNLAKEMLTACTDSCSVGKLILGRKSQEMFCTEECLEAGPSETEQCGRRQERESKLSDALMSLVPAKSLFMAKGVAFHEYTSFLGRMSKLEEIRLSCATTVKRRARGFRHYLNTGPFMMSSESITALVRHSSFGEASRM